MGRRIKDFWKEGTQEGQHYLKKGDKYPLQTYEWFVFTVILNSQPKPGLFCFSFLQKNFLQSMKNGTILNHFLPAIHVD